VWKGDYRVRAVDVPLAEIYQCVPGRTELCLCQLAAGQENGRIDRTADVQLRSCLSR
jgi:hypothetical protein